MQFKGKHWFLSNMYPADIRLRLFGVPYTFTCVEAAFQACKCPERAREFVGLDGFAAKKLGRRVKLRRDWEAVKLDVMEQLLRMKFTQHPELMNRLRDVRENIVEENTWNDKFWGVCNGTGLNHLGILLMKLRDEGR